MEKNKHFFAIIRKTREGARLVELVENTPSCWRNSERKELRKKYYHSKYIIFEFSTYNVENYLPNLLIENTYKKRTFDKN